MALRSLGAVCVEGQTITAKANKLKGVEINFSFPSVGATENAMLTAVYAEGTTIIRNAAKEPEIEDLQGYLNVCGAKVTGAGTDTIIIEGVETICTDVNYSIMPDRIEAGTFLLAAAATGGNVSVRNIIPTHIFSLIEVLHKAGCTLEITSSCVNIKSDGCIMTNMQELFVKTLPYPGFPTDLQAPLTSLLCTAGGKSFIQETIFENRFRHVQELIKMGADIKFNSKNQIEISGGTIFHGAKVISSDLRCGAALVIAGLAAEGISYISDDHYIERGYSNFEEKLRGLGARISVAELCKVHI